MIGFIRKQVALSPYWALFGWRPQLTTRPSGRDIVVANGATSLLHSWWGIALWPITLALLFVSAVFIALIPVFILFRLEYRLRIIGVPFSGPIAFTTLTIVGGAIYLLYLLFYSSTSRLPSIHALDPVTLATAIIVVIATYSLSVPIVLILSSIALKLRPTS